MVSIVWNTPNFMHFFDRHALTFRRIVQLCETSCAEKFASERLFPGLEQCMYAYNIYIYIMSCAEKFASERLFTGGVEKERAFVVSGFVSEWMSGGWNLQVLTLLALLVQDYKN